MMTDWAARTPTRHGQAWVRRGSEDTAVFNPDTGTLHALNVSALAIWELCDGSTSGEEMAGAVAELTGLPFENAAGDVRIALDELERQGLIDV
jgi:PqqD family protein of HPr-rel-A system